MSHEACETKTLALLSPWAGRGNALAIAGGVIGFLLGGVVVFSVKPPGAMAFWVMISFVVVSAILAWCNQLRPPKWVGIRLHDDRLELEGRDGAVHPVPFEELRLFQPEVVGLIVLLPGVSEAFDLMFQDRFVRLYASGANRGTIYRHIEKHAASTMIFIGKARVPAPPDTLRADWLQRCQSVVQRLHIRILRQSLWVAVLSAGAFVAAVAAQVVAYLAIGEDAIHGMLLLAMIVPAAVAVISFWTALGAWRDGRDFQRELESLGGDIADYEVDAHGRVAVDAREPAPLDASGKPAIPASAKWASALSVPLSLVPVLGLVLAIKGLYHTWERSVIWNLFAWWGMIFSCVVTICAALVLAAYIFGWE